MGAGLVSQNSEYLLNGAALDSDANELTIDLSRPRKIRVVGIDEQGNHPVREYFLKVTERKGLVLV